MPARLSRPSVKLTALLVKTMMRTVIGMISQPMRKKSGKPGTPT